MNMVILNIMDYDRLKAYDEAAEKNYDIKISKGGYHEAYILRTESDTIKSLKKQIEELQEKVNELENRKQKKWYSI